MKSVLRKIYESVVFSVIITVFFSNMAASIRIILGVAGRKLLPATGFYRTAVMYGAFLAYWVVFVLVMLLCKRDRPFLQKLGHNSGNTPGRTALGAFLGFATNAVCVLAAVLLGKIFLSKNPEHDTSELVVLFLLVLIQSSAEELMTRLFLFQRIKLRYPSGIPSAIISAVYFATQHLANPGINIIAVINLLISAIIFALIIYYFDAFWCSAMFHTLWNYTQNIIFGLPNSGIVSQYSIFKLDATAEKNSFVYNNEFGVEGTVLSVIVLSITMVGVIIIGEMKKKKERALIAQASGEANAEDCSAEEK